MDKGVDCRQRSQKLKTASKNKVDKLEINNN